MKRGLVALMLWPALAWADTVYLEGGRTIDGVVVERTDTTVVIDIGPGRVGLPLSRVTRIVTSRSPLAEYRERARQLGSGDVAGWLRLADWAEGAGLKTQAREACEQVLRSDPLNSTAQRCLGRVLHDGQWLTFEESQRARGLLQYGSRWVTPAEHEQLIASESQAGLARRAQQEAEARVQEAEARAREAEARARAAEQDADASSGPLYWPPFGGGLSGCASGCGPGCARSCDPQPPRPAPSVAPSEPPSKPRRSGMTRSSAPPQSSDDGRERRQQPPPPRN